MTEAEHYDPKQHWFHRRVHSYMAWGGLAMVLVGMFKEWIPDGSLPLASTLVWALVSVIGLYHVGCGALDGLARLRAAK